MSPEERKIIAAECRLLAEELHALGSGAPAWSAIFTSLRGGKLLQPVQPSVHLAEILTDSPELLHERLVLRRIARIHVRFRDAGDEMPPLLGGHHQAPTAQHLQPVPHCHARHPVLAGQLAFGR